MGDNRTLTRDHLMCYYEYDGIVDICIDNNQDENHTHVITEDRLRDVLDLLREKISDEIDTGRNITWEQMLIERLNKIIDECVPVFAEQKEAQGEE